MRHGLQQFLAAFLATLICLLLLIKTNLLAYLSYTVEKGRLRAAREVLPTQGELASRTLDSRLVADLVAPAVVSVVVMPSPDFHAPAELRDPGDSPPSAPEDGASAEPDERPEAGGGSGRFGLRGIGSGFVFDADRGLIVTNAHVVEGARSLRVHLADGRLDEGRVLGLDPISDLAVMEVSLRPLHALEFCDSSLASVGEEVFSVGSPFGLAGTFSKGIISAARGRNVSVSTGQYAGLLQTDAVVNPGNSGGPLVNMRGEVIGVNTAIASLDGVYAGVGFAIPSNRVQEMLDDLIDGGPAFLGVQPVDAARLAYAVEDLSWGADHGAMIREVVANSAADRAGVRVDDIVDSVNDERVRDARHLIRIIADHRPGDRLSLRLWRQGAWDSVDIPLGRRYEPR